MIKKEQSAKNKVQRGGFTLIELLVVIAVIGILSSLIVVNFNAARERARDVQRKSDLNEVKKALRLYYNDNNVYPASLPDWGKPFESSGGEVTYMNALPVDPKPGTTTPYVYDQVPADGQNFCLAATLENKSDQDIATSQVRCPDCGVSDEDTDYVVCAD